MALGKEFFKNTFKIAGSTALAQGIGIVTIPIFARIFSPEIVGQYALFTSLVGILSLLGTGRYEAALMLPKERERAINILWGALGIALLWSIVLWILIFSFKESILAVENYRNLHSYLLWIPVVVLLTCWNRVLLYWFNREKQFGINAILNVFNLGGTKIANISVGGMGYISVGALIYVNLFVLNVEFLLRSLISGRTLLKEKLISWRKIKRELVRYKKFPLIDSWNGLLDTGSLLIVPVLLSLYFSDEVGLYNQSLVLVQLPIVLIASAFGQVLYQRLCEAKYTGEIGQIVADIFVLLLQIGIPVFLIIFLWGKEIFTIFLGERWAISGTYAEMLAPWCCLKLCFSPLSSIFNVEERQGFALFLTITIIVTRVLSIFIGGIYGSVYIAILLFGISGVVLNLLGIIMVMFLAKQKFSNLVNSFCKNPLKKNTNDFSYIKKNPRQRRI